MKKITAVFLALFCAMSISTAAFATGNTEQSETAEAVTDESASGDESTATDGAHVGEFQSGRLQGTGEITSPLDYWNETGWPEDISFACEVGGEMAEDDTILVYWEIGVVNADEARKNEIVSLFANSCLITLVDCSYSHAQREAALFEIETEVKEKHDDNYIYGMLINNTEQIYIVVKDSAYNKYSRQYEERYGELVWVQKESEAAVNTYLDGAETGFGTIVGMGEAESDQNSWLLPLLLFVFVMSIGGVFLWRKFRPVAAKQTAQGAIAAQEQPLTRSQTVEAVKSSELTPRGGLFEDMRKKLKK